MNAVFTLEPRVEKESFRGGEGERRGGLGEGTQGIEEGREEHEYMWRCDIHNAWILKIWTHPNI